MAVRLEAATTTFVTLEGIPVLETGIEYPASTGPFTVTPEMIQDAIDSQDDPHVLPPRIKIAHAENPINGSLQELWDSVNGERDGSQPALGTLLNLRSTNGGQTLVADFYGLPGWLAAILETAYPARSIEGGAWKNSANNKEYSFMIEAVSLLGVVGPGCTSLDDLQELFSKEGPKVSVIEMPKPKMEGGSVPRVVAQVNVEDIRRAFYDDFAQGDYYWWWDRELLIDPLEFIVQDPDEGQLYRLPIETTTGKDGTDAVTFGEPAPVKVKYVPDTVKKDKVEASRLIAPQLKGTGAVLAVNTTPPRERERQNRKETTMAKKKVALELDIPALRARLGLTAEQLPDDATDDQINTALTTGSSPDPAPPAVDSLDTPESGTAAAGTPQPPDGETQEPATPPPAAMSVDPGALAQLQQDAALGRQARETQIAAERETFLDAHMGLGKFPPSSREAYLTQMKQGGAIEVAIRSHIEQLAPGVIPVGEIGGDDGGAQMAGSGGEYIDNHLTEGERARIQAHRSGQPLPTPRLVTEA